MKKIFYCFFIISLFIIVGSANTYAIEDKFSPHIYSDIKLKACEFDIENDVLISICEGACDISESEQDKLKPLYRCIKDYAIKLWLAQMGESEAAKIKASEDFSDIKRSIAEYVNNIKKVKFSEFYMCLKSICRFNILNKWFVASEKASDMLIVAKEQEPTFVNFALLAPMPKIEEMLVVIFEWYPEEFLMEKYLFDLDAFKHMMSERIKDFLVSYYFIQRYPSSQPTFSGCGDFEKIKDLVCKACEIFSCEKSVVTSPEEPVLVVGDLHGNEYSLAKSIRVTKGELLTGAAKSVVFLGDYIDRGFHSVEVIEKLLEFKLKFPDKVFLLRGNHENAMIEPNTFVAELNKKFGLKDGLILCNLFYKQLFQLLPLAAQISLDNGKKVFCAHAGFPDPFSDEEMKMFLKLRDLPTKDAFNKYEFYRVIKSMLWNDPMRGDVLTASRGNFLFSNRHIESFFSIVGCDYLVRGHEFIPTGFLEEFDGRCYTVFSSANYFDNNCGIIAKVSSEGIRPFAKILRRDIEMLDMTKSM